MNNSSKAIITSASNKFFPSLLNLLGSIETNYPNHPDVYVYDLGLFFTFKKELQQIPWVHILEVPHFAPHWRSCYTWKTYILNTSIKELNLYIDAGCQVLRSLDQLFEKINTQDYLAVGQGSQLMILDITPKDYVEKFELSKDKVQKEVITAGIFGFKENSSITPITAELYVMGIDGLCLGFSPTEQWKNKGVNKNSFIRNCKMFRHDTTLLSILLHRNIFHPIIEPIDLFSGNISNSPNQYIWNMRMNYRFLNYISIKKLHSSVFNIFSCINRLYILVFILLKIISNKIKSKIKVQ